MSLKCARLTGEPLKAPPSLAAQAAISPAANSPTRPAALGYLLGSSPLAELGEALVVVLAFLLR